MNTIIKKIMISACKNRLAEGKTWDGIHQIYPKLTEEELAEIKAAVESET